MTRKRSEGDRQRAMRRCPVHVHVCDVGPSDEPPSSNSYTQGLYTLDFSDGACKCGEAKHDGLYFVRDLPRKKRPHV